jgi:hypothetical protein
MANGPARALQLATVISPLGGMIGVRPILGIDRHNDSNVFEVSIRTENSLAGTGK